MTQGIMEKSQWDLKKIRFQQKRLTRLDDFVHTNKVMHNALLREYQDSLKTKNKVMKKTLNPSLSTSNLKEAQEKHRQLSTAHTISDGELYYICKRRQNKTEHLAKVVSTAEEDQLFKEFHSSNIGGHCGVEKTHCALIARYYWPGMESDIRKWIAQCSQCQAKRANIKEKQEYSPIEVNSALCERLDIKRSLCSAYHPQTNGLVEKLNGTKQR
ncbi:hypothetical protein KUCAC02_000357 [Chaenocephalus aceratus]|uniref:Uncharacterized protein n=1 Tax=Chaenocephalus aceratus TaxID=36190 RepID=A0ACB9W693_CHAAC|nr:hypothetical protein KUCAC02_000357 [Chaenocephalus aceratus]